jgi:hypothetical protein
VLRFRLLPPIRGHARWLNAVAQLDGVIAISRAVANELQAWLAAHGPGTAAASELPGGISAQISSCRRPGVACRAMQNKVLDRLRSAPAF